MYREIIIGGIHIHTYGIMQALAFITVVFLMIREGKKKNISADTIYDIVFYILIGDIIGARLWFVIENWNLFANTPMDIIKIWQGGLTFYGGFIGGILGALLFIKQKKLNLKTMTDLLSSYLPIGIAIGRIGCFLNGCCYGKISLSFGIPYPTFQHPPAFYEQIQKGLITPDAKWTLPVIPTQIISSIDMLIAFVIIYLYKKSKHYIEGTIIYLFFVLYGLHRVFIDMFREYTGNALILKIMTLSQFTSIILIVFGTYMIIKTRKHI